MNEDQNKVDPMWDNGWQSGYNSRQLEIDGLKAQLESLSSDTRTLEEVLDKCLKYDTHLVSNQLIGSLLSAMQEVERMARLKGLNEAAGYVEENISLKQQLSIMAEDVRIAKSTVDHYENQYLEMAKIAREAAEENERLKVELEKKDKAFGMLMRLRDRNNEAYDKEIQDLKTELDKHRWIPISERLPEEKDGDEYGDIESLCDDLSVGIQKWDDEVTEYDTHWRRIIKPSPPKP